MLDTRAELDFVDAVRNLRRFDETFVNTAFARHPSGVALTTLSDDLASMRAISFASAVGTLDRLRAFFDHQIVDLGGFSNLDFVAQVVADDDETWLVCDPNVNSTVSAPSLLRELRAGHPEEAEAAAPSASKAQPALVVNRFDAALNFGADQLAARLGLPLATVLPERGRAVNQGRLLCECDERDPYVRALTPLLSRLARNAEAEARAAQLAHFLPSFLRRS